MANSQLQELFRSSLESHEPKPAVEQIDGVDSMESAILDIEEGYQGVSSLESDIDELEQIAEGMESLKDSVEASLEDGGLDAAGAQMLHHAVDAHTSRLGLESGELLPGLESFGGDSGRQSATSVSMESVKETLKKIYEAVKRAVEKAIKMVADFFTRIFGGIDKVKKRSEALRKKLKEAEKEGAKAEGKMNVPNAASLHVGGHATYKAINDGLEELKKQNESVFGDYIKEVPDFYEAMAKKIVDSKDAKDESALEEIQKAVAEGSSEVVEKVTADVSPQFSGGKVLRKVTRQQGEEESSELNLEDADKTSGSSADAEIDVPSASELEAILDHVNGIIKHVEDSKKGIDAIKKAREDAMKQVGELAKEAEKGRLGKAWSGAKAQVVMRLVQRDLVRPVTALTSHDFSVARAALALVERGVKQYKKEGDKKDEEGGGEE